MSGTIVWTLTGKQKEDFFRLLPDAFEMAFDLAESQFSMPFEGLHYEVVRDTSSAEGQLKIIVYACFSKKCAEEASDLLFLVE